MSVNQVNQTTGALSPIAGGTLYADMAVGTIVPYGGSTAPNGFLLCQGQSLLRTEYAELFAAIGTSFGSADSTHFNVPDLRGKVPVGYDSTQTEFNTLGKTGGEKTHTLTLAEMPYHAHSFGYAGNIYAGNGPTGYWTGYDSPTSAYSKGTGYQGGSQAHNNLQPYNTVNYIIKATSIALPSDFASSVDDAIDAKIVDTIADGNMKAVTSNAVYDALPKAGSFRTQGILVGNNIIDITSYTPQSGTLPSTTTGCIFFIQGFWNQIDYDANIVCDNNRIYIKATKENPGGLSIVWIQA